MGRNTLDWTWFRQASDSQQEVMLLLVACLGLAIGAVVAAVLWRRRDGSSVWSLAAGCLAAELPLAHFGYSLAGLLGTYAGWATGLIVAFPFVTLTAAALYRARPRAATWGLTTVLLQLQVLAVTVGAWTLLALGAGALAAVWCLDYVCRPGGVWESRVEKWLQRRGAYVAAGLATVYPLFVAWLLHSGSSEAAVVGQHMVRAFPLHEVGFAIQFTWVLSLLMWLLGFARDLPHDRRVGLQAALLPLVVWFVLERSTPVTFADVSTFGVLFSLLFVLTSAASVRREIATR